MTIAIIVTRASGSALEYTSDERAEDVAAFADAHKLAVDWTNQIETGARLVGDERVKVWRSPIVRAQADAEPTLVLCASCGAEVSPSPAPSPADDPAWRELASEHEDGCAFIATRAGRRPPDLAVDVRR